INWAVGTKGMKGIAMWDLGQAIPVSGTMLTNIWNAIAGTSACVTVGTNPCAPFTCTFTATPTGTPACGTKVDDFETGLTQNALGGYWSSYAPAGTTMTEAPTSGDGLNGSVYGGRMNGTTSLANSPSASCGLGLSGATFNASTKGQTGFTFTIRVDAGAGGAVPAATGIFFN